MNEINNIDRYLRQITLKEFGLTGQKKLLQSSVLVIGAGGLGCPALLYLTAAGIGKIGVADFDLIELSNLPRQIIYTVHDIGKPKAEIAVNRLTSMNPDTKFNIYNNRIQNYNALDTLRKYDIVIDATDNFSSRYLINDACALLDKPLIYGAVFKMEGQAGVFNLKDPVTHLKTNYRDLFPSPVDAASSVSCDEAGVIGLVPGIIGMFQAMEAIKIISGMDTPLYNSIISYNASTNSINKFIVHPNKNPLSSIPKNESEFLSFDYELFCGASVNSENITINEFDDLRSNDKIRIIDVREINEYPPVDEFDHINIPLSLFDNFDWKFPDNTSVVLFCQTGKRSLIAAKKLYSKFPNLKVYNLSGGIEKWKENYLKVNV